MLTVEKNGKPIKIEDEYIISHPSYGVLFDMAVHEIKYSDDRSWFWPHVKSVQWCWLFDDRDQFDIKILIFGYAHIARIVDIDDNKFDIWIKR